MATKSAWLLGKMAAVVVNSRATFMHPLSRNVYFEEAKKRLFHSYGIKDVLLKRLKNLRIEKPTAIQEKVSCVFARAVKPAAQK